MASSVQVEHGHVRIANPIVEAMAMAPFSPAQLRILLFVVRMTWGWQRKDAPLSYTQLSAGTGLGRSSVSETVTSLVDAGVLIAVRPPSFREPGVYRIQKDPRRWKTPFRCTPPSLAPTTDSTADPNSTTDANSTADPNSTESANRTVPQIRTQSTADPNCSAPQLVETQHLPKSERQVQIKTIKKQHLSAAKAAKSAKGLLAADAFADFQRTYPSRSGAQRWKDAQRHWNARIRDGTPPADMVAAAKRYAAFVEQAGNTGSQYVKQAATFLGDPENITDPWTSKPPSPPARPEYTGAINGSDRKLPPAPPDRHEQLRRPPPSGPPGPLSDVVSAAMRQVGADG